MPGPAPMPAALKLVNGRHAGVDSSGKKVELPPGYERGEPDMPPEVSEDADARKMWELVAPALNQLDLLKPIDMGSVASYCMCWARLVQAQRDIKERGLIVLGRHDVEVKNPSVGIAEGASREMRMWAQEFGLTPSAEGRIHAVTSNAEMENAEAFD